MSNRGFDLLNHDEHNILSELNNRLSQANGRSVHTEPIATPFSRESKEERRPMPLNTYGKEPTRIIDLVPSENDRRFSGDSAYSPLL